MADFIETLSANFVGRICTVLTHPVSFQFSDAVQHSQFFSGKVEEINKDGIWLRHVHTNTVTFYTFPIIGIVEEQVIPKDDPRAVKLKEDMEKKEQEKKDRLKPKLPPQGQFIPVDSLSKIVRDAKK